MTVHYQLVFGVLALEVALFFLLSLPLPFNLRHKAIKLLRDSPYLSQIRYGLGFLFLFVFILFWDSINAYLKATKDQLGASEKDHKAHTFLHSKRFYAQRNIYLTGAVLFLALILNRYQSILTQLFIQETKIAELEEELNTKVKALTLRLQEAEREGDSDTLFAPEELKMEKTKAPVRRRIVGDSNSVETAVADEEDKKTM